MGTLVTIHIVHDILRESRDADAAITRAFGWFHEIEARCSRFDEKSELRRLIVGSAIEVSPILFEAIRFSLMVAEESGGAFDPTVGQRMVARGFNREHRVDVIEDTVSYRDVRIDAGRRTITLLRPLTLDLGAVAKGLAVDAAARELKAFQDFAIDAGGDLYLGGSNERGEPWSVGIRHPREDDAVIATLRVSNQAVCTSGDYERRTPDGAEHHIVDPRTGTSPDSVISATVVAPGAMLADALATAAFVLGPREGVEFLTRSGVDGLIVTSDLKRYETEGLVCAA
jgi:thiamine biosynthesis lipoprotein